MAARSIASEQETDIAKAASDIADAKVIVNQRALELAIAGPRQEEIAQAQAQLRSARRNWPVATAARRYGAELPSTPWCARV